MIEAIDEALRSLQASLFASEVYFPEHPAARNQLDRAANIIRGLLADRAEITVSAFEDRVVFEAVPLPSSAELVAGLFERLRQRGKEFITFIPGVTDAELKALIEWLGTRSDGDLDDTHLATGTLRLGDDDEGGDLLPADSRMRRHAEILSEMSVLLLAGRNVNMKALSAVVGDICTTVVMSQGELLPLASLKRHDEYSFIHSVNVAILSAALAETVGVPPEWMMDLTTAALLHDVGKQRIPAEVLQKEGALTDDEMRIVRQHPVTGAAMLMGTDGMPDLAPVVAFEHHMGPDGSGYPQVPGRRPHALSKLVQVADVFDALSTHRPYRAGMPIDQASRILREQVGPHAPELVAAFLEHVAARTDRHIAPEDLEHQIAA